MSVKQKECEYVVDPFTFGTVLFNRKTGFRITLDLDYEGDGDIEKNAMWTAVHLIEGEKFVREHEK